MKLNNRFITFGNIFKKNIRGIINILNYKVNKNNFNNEVGRMYKIIYSKFA